MPTVARGTIGVVFLVCWCVPDVAFGQNTPFSGMAFLHTDIIKDTDWSAFDSMTYTGLANRKVFDRRVNQWLLQPIHLFDASFQDGLTSEMQINPELGGQSTSS